MERLRLDATARLAGHAVVEKGTHVEILGSQRRVRVDAVEYDGYPDRRWWQKRKSSGGAPSQSRPDTLGI